MHCLLIATACLLTPFQIDPDIAARNPRQIIDLAIKAVGGESALKKMKISTVSDEGTYHALGQAKPTTVSFIADKPPG